MVLLASYVYENVRLLLLSTSPAYPKGLANNHGQVGRHYFGHNLGGGVTALFPRNLNNWYGLPAQGTAVDDWADDNFDHQVSTSSAAGTCLSTRTVARSPRQT